MSRVALEYTAISRFALTTGQIDIALWSGVYVIYNPVVSFDLRCQSGIKGVTLASVKKIVKSKELAKK